MLAMNRTRGRLSVLLVLALMLPTLAACAPQSPGAPTAAPVPPTPPPTQQALGASGLTTPAPAAAAPAASPVSKPQADQPKRGGTFTEAAIADAVSFHPYLTTDTASSDYQGNVYGGELWRYNKETLVPEADAAKSWTISPDHKTYTFTLRDDLKWSDGKPMTSADYKFAYDIASKPENKYPYISNLELIQSYETPDPKTIVVTMNDAIAVGLEAANAITPLPKHIWEKLDWSDPTKNPEIMAPSVSSGPYKLKEWKKDDHATFEANELFYRGRPNIDSITIRVVPNQEIAYQMLKTGEVDTAPLTPDNVPEAETLPNLTVYKWWPARATWSYIGFNLRRPVLQDLDVRRALSHAVDRRAIAERIQNNLAQPNFTPFPSTTWVHNPNVPKYEFNPDRARQLLDDAGWKLGPDDVRVKDGQKLSLKILFGPNTNKPRERVAVATQQWLRDIGVAAEVQGLEWGAYLSALKSEPFDYDLYVGAWSATIEPHWMNQIWLQESIPDLNAGAYVNKQVEALFGQAVREFDMDKRRQLYQQIQQIMVEEAPYIWTTFSQSYGAINKRIGGVEVTKLGMSDFEKWYVK
jgi:peptide/nickel transport system substrate-binding protein